LQGPEIQPYNLSLPATEQNLLNHGLMELHSDIFKVRHLGHEEEAGVFPETLPEEYDSK
jgi:hypothetical protein